MYQLLLLHPTLLHFDSGCADGYAIVARDLISENPISIHVVRVTCSFEDISSDVKVVKGGN
jgi:hypothetical protein